MKKLYLWISIGIIMVGVNIANNFAGVYTYHAVYMYNFIKYIEWPKGKLEGPFIIGVMGQSPILNELNDMALKRKIGTRSIAVNNVTSAKDIAACNILFIPDSNNSDIDKAIASCKNSGVLVITESPGMSKKGAAINFIFIDGKLKFEINKNAAKEAKLNVSGELLKLGITVD